MCMHTFNYMCMQMFATRVRMVPPTSQPTNTLPTHHTPTQAAAARRERRMERRQRDSLEGLFEGDEGEEEQELDLGALGRGLHVRVINGVAARSLWVIYHPQIKTTPRTYTYFPKPIEKNQGGEEVTFDFEGDDDDDDDDSSSKPSDNNKPPTPDDDPYVLWPPEVEKLPLGDICFLLRSGVIAAKNVPERRAGGSFRMIDDDRMDGMCKCRWWGPMQSLGRGDQHTLHVDPRLTQMNAPPPSNRIKPQTHSPRPSCRVGLRLTRMRSSTTHATQPWTPLASIGAPRRPMSTCAGTFS